VSSIAAHYRHIIAVWLVTAGAIYLILRWLAVSGIGGPGVTFGPLEDQPIGSP
jgi:hypothetical protein